MGRGIDPTEGTVAGVVLPKEKADGERGEEQRFDGQADEGAERRLLPEQLVRVP